MAANDYSEYTWGHYVINRSDHTVTAFGEEAANSVAKGDPLPSSEVVMSIRVRAMISRQTPKLP